MLCKIATTCYNINMRGIKYLPIKTVNEVKETFDFFKKCAFHTCETECSVSLPMHEIYQAMMENVETKTNIQFYAVYEKEIIGSIIAVKLNDKELFLSIVAVSSKYRGKGIAKRFMTILAKSAKKEGFKNLQINADANNSGFFLKEGFVPYLYVKASSLTTIEEVEDANHDGLEKVALFPFDNMIKFAVPDTNKKWLKPFISCLSDFQAKFTYEKQI